MHGLLSSVLEKIRDSAQLTKIIDNSDLTVCFMVEDERWFIFFQEGHVHMEYQADTDGDVVIEGNMEAIRLLLNGDDFLLSMIKRGELQADGSLKNLLLLESIFYLSKKA